MTVFDYAVLGIAGASTLLGAWRGIVSELLALAAWVVGFLAAREWAGEAGSALRRWFPDPAMQYIAGFALVFVGMLLALALLRFALRQLLKAAGLGFTDRFLGGVFGLGRAGVIVLGVVLAAGLTALPRERWWREAVLAPPIETAALMLRPWLPDALAKRIRYR